MITDPFALLAYLVAIIAALFWLSDLPALRRVFHFVPPVLWILLIPTLSTTFGLIPVESPVYDWLQNRVLVAALVLLLLATNLRAILRLGRPALTMMLTASGSIAVSAIIVFAAVRFWLPPDAWKSIAALMGVWTGGYGNMVAVSTSVDASAAMLTNAIITDTIVGYGWMSLLITLAPAQDAIDRHLKADRSILDDINRRLGEVEAKLTRPTTITDVASMMGIAIGIAYLASRAGQALPQISGIISAFTWSVIIASAVAIVLSLTRLGNLGFAGATPVGTFLLYMAYAAIGARANMSDVGSAPLFLFAGVLILLLHATVMLLTARWLKIPIFAAVVASQANVGGMATAPIVAAIYQRSLAGVAVLLVPLGLAYGTFVALAVGAVCRLIAGAG